MKKYNSTIYIVRHGQAHLNTLGKIGGTFEPNHLTEKGMDQAHSLANSLKDINIDVIYSSDLSRAKETADIIANAKGLKVITNKLLRERYWGRLQNKTFIEAKKEYPISFQEELGIEGPTALDFKYVDDMESLRETVERFETFLKKEIDMNKGKTILIVCHFDIMMGYLVKIGIESYQKLMNCTFSHTGYYKLVGNDKKVEMTEIVGIER